MMASFQRTLLLCCICCLVAAAAAIFCHPSPETVAGRLSNPTAPTAVTTQVPYWMWLALVSVSLAMAIWLAAVLRWRLQRDVSHLREAICQLTSPHQDKPRKRLAIAELEGCAGKLAEVEEQIRVERARLCADATLDPLTGLSNRRPFVDTLARETAFARRAGTPLSLIMVDLDRFKVLNDTYGHNAGDAALCNTADRLASLVRQSDSVARFGGEEFAIVLPGTRLDQATRIAQQICDALRCDELVYEGVPISVTASFGVAELHECGLTDSESLISHADAAMYAAKRNGRDSVVAAQADAGGPRSTAGPTQQAAHNDSAEESREDTVDRDALALMGSTFSVLQVMPDKHRVASDVVQQVASVLKSPSARLYLFVEGGEQLDPIVSIGCDDDRLPPGEHAQAWADALGASGRLEGSRCIKPGQIETVCGCYETSVLRLPLVAYGQMVGVIEAEDSTDGAELSERQRTILSALSSIGAAALQNCAAYEGTTNRLCGLVEALCRTIHAHDAYRRDHAEWVSSITVEVATAMGQQDAEELQLLRVAGLVHDIGNAGLPGRLLKKRGRLRESEWKQVREHSNIGADIIEAVDEMDRLAAIVRHHHEHFDGGGYPSGLKGNAIPLESRIIAVADAYVAMRSPRPYRPALSHDEAVERIREEAGRQFDPAIVEVFVQCASRSSAVPTPNPTTDAAARETDTVLTSDK